MSNLRLLAGLLSAAFVGQAAATDVPPVSGFYVVVPLEARAFGAAEGIRVSLNSATLPTGIVGLPYESFSFLLLLNVSGDPGYTGYGVKWEVVSGSLPAGLVLGADGRLTGTPTTNGTSDFELRATYKTKSGSQAFQVFVGSITIELASATPPQAIVGQAYSYDLKPHLSISGDPAYTGAGVTWSTVSSSLPAGLYLRNDGTIGGTPTAGGKGTLTARASYRNNAGQQSYEVVSLAISVNLAGATPPQAIVGQAYSYDLKQHLAVSGDQAYSGSGVTWSTVDSSLPAGLALQSDGTITGMPTAAGTGAVTARATYRNVKGEQTYQVVTLHINVALAAGTPHEAIVGQFYSYDLKGLLSVTGDSSYNGTGVEWTYVNSSLPSGIVLRTDGTISGTPTAAGAGSVTARATYRNVRGERTYQVVTLGINVSLAAGTPPQAIVGQAYSYDLKPLLSVSGDNSYTVSNVSWSVVENALPAGLYLRNDGAIVGTPTASGTGRLVARATYRGVTGDREYQVVSLNITVSLAAATLPQARVGVSYTYDIKPHLQVTGDPSYSASGITWSTVGNSLPAGLALTASGTISGTPSVSGSGSLTARATYRSVSGQQTYSVTALPAWTYAWAQSTWSTTPACGTTTASRSVWCAREDGATVADANCTGTKPATSQSVTDYSSCTYSFSYSAYGSCSASCGGGTQYRTATCYRSDGTSVANSNCGTPTLSRSCNTQSCAPAYTYSWNYGSWNTSPACGATTSTRSVWCERSDGSSVSDAYCSGSKPASSQSTTNYSGCSYSFNYSGWTSCSATCGGGTQTRTATCTRSDGASASSSYCGTPVTSQSCNTQACAPTYSYSWSYTGWSGCSASCGGGTQTRSATCMRSDGTQASSSNCGAVGATSMSCNTQACATYTWVNSGYKCQSGNRFAVDRTGGATCSSPGATVWVDTGVDGCSVYDTTATDWVQYTCK